MAEESFANQETGAAESGEVDWKAKYEEMREHSREWQKRAESNKAAVEELAQLKEAQMTNEQKLTARAEKAEKEAAMLKAEKERRIWISEVAKETGLAVETVELLRGDTKEDLLANAKAIAPKPAPKVSSEGGKPADGGDDPMRAAAKMLFSN